MPTVVVLDENAPIRELLSEWLAGAGHRLADAHMAPEEVHIVLIDLPQLRDGAAARLARARAAFPRAALLGLSTQLSRSLPRHSPTARALGLVGLLAKPCVREELLATVAAAVIAGPAAPPAAAPDADPA